MTQQDSQSSLGMSIAGGLAKQKGNWQQRKKDNNDREGKMSWPEVSKRITEGGEGNFSRKALKIK